MKRLRAIACLSVLVLNCQPNVGQEHLIKPKQLFQVLSETDNIQLIDVRTSKEYKTSHIKGAVNFNFFDDNFVEQINTLNKSEPVYVYCRSGKRSGKSISEFEKLSFEKIYSLDGGIKKWIETGYKTTP